MNQMELSSTIDVNYSLKLNWFCDLFHSFYFPVSSFISTSIGVILS